MSKLLSFRDFILIKKSISVLILKLKRERDLSKKRQLELKVSDLQRKILMSDNIENIFNQQL